MKRSLSLVFLSASLAACSGGVPPVVDCRVGADCASGVCRGDGTCGPAVVDAGEDAGYVVGPDGGLVQADGGLIVLVRDGGNEVDSGIDAGFDAGMTAGCIPNNDGRIERSEVFFQAGLRATFKISGSGTFQTAGGVTADGGSSWDFTAPLAGDSSRLVETRRVSGEWFESKYPDAGYVTDLGSQADKLLGVFSTSSDALYLQGVVSNQVDGGTAIKYSPWVKVLQFPLEAGDTWTTNTTVSGVYNRQTIGTYLPLPPQQEKYEVTVDRQGEVLTPFANFSALRVRTVMTRSFSPTFYPNITVRSFSWNTECFGTVATVSATENEASTEFSNVTEVRRISP